MKELGSERRHLSYELQEAHKLAEGIFSDDTIEQQKNLARRYIDNHFDKKIVLVDDQNNVLLVDYSCRFSPRYKRKVRKRLKKGIDTSYKYFMHVVLTLNHTRYLSQMAVKREVQRAWNRLATEIRRKYPWVKFNRTVEWQKNGKGAHLHVILYGIRFIPKAFFLKYWSEKSGRAVQLRSLSGDKKAMLSYTLKYITKSSLRLSEDQEPSLSQIINWATYSRSYSQSRSLGVAGSNSTDLPSKWVYVGVIPLSMVTWPPIDILRYLSWV